MVSLGLLQSFSNSSLFLRSKRLKETKNDAILKEKEHESRKHLLAATRHAPPSPPPLASRRKTRTGAALQA